MGSLSPFREKQHLSLAAPQEHVMDHYTQSADTLNKRIPGCGGEQRSSFPLGKVAVSKDNSGSTLIPRPRGTFRSNTRQSNVSFRLTFDQNV